jgi:site-specific DNA-cytosine methylase
MENVPEITKNEILGEIIERFKEASYGLTST